MRQRKRTGTKALTLLLTLALLLSLFVTPALAKKVPTLPTDMDALVDLIGDHVDGESAFDYLGTVYLGWRTTGGPWQNYLINDFIGSKLEAAGYGDAGDFVVGTSTTDPTDAYGADQYWVQHDASTSLVWAPEYARLEITGITTSGGTPVDATAVKAIVDVESWSYDPTSAIYQEHYKTEYGLSAANTDEFVTAMSGWINTKDAGGARTKVFPEGEDLGAARGEEAHLNLRAHLATNTGFNVTASELNAIRSAPANAANLVAGKTGKLVYVGRVTSSGGVYSSSYAGDVADLAGAILLCDSSHRNNFNYAKQVGAVATMTTASLSNYSTPAGTGLPWYGGNNTSEWYTNSARFAGGAGAASNKAAMDAGTPIVEWNISLDQYAALKAQCDAGNNVTMNVASVGTMYPMSDDSNPAAQGQLTVIAEIKGSDPELQKERVVLAAHVQEPSSNDNATGVALNLELAVRMKQLIDAGILPRPQRTLVFMWGDEMAFSRLYLNAHEDQIDKIICCIDLDMVGEDPAKTGGPMRIEKAPDPSAYYNYTLDNIPEDPLYYDPVTRSDEYGDFVRLPDSHTLWGAGDPEDYDLGGIFINDLYMAAAQATQTKVKSTLGYDFEVDVCPYEGGSDHSRFLERGIPSVLTWHFTDYTYHTTVDTLYMSSADELESVGITSLAAGYYVANPTESYTAGMLAILKDAAATRFETERENTEAHAEWAKLTHNALPDALAQEKEVLTAWADWYREAGASCAQYFGSYDGFAAQLSAYTGQITGMETIALGYADGVFAAADLDGALTLDNSVIELFGSGTYAATLTVSKPTGSGTWTNAQWNAWANGLTWSLTRTAADYEQDTTIYPYYYPGDELANWSCWTTGATSTDFFTLQDPVVDHSGAEVKLTLNFSSAPFFGNINSTGTRNAWQSFIGDYHLTVASGAEKLGDTLMTLVPYETYTRYDDLGETLEEIKALAEAKGRYFEIVENTESVGGRIQYYVVLSDSAASVASFKATNAIAETDPASLQARIEAGTLTYRVPFLVNNVHSDECPGVTAAVNLLRTLATADTITYNTLTGLATNGTVESYESSDGVLNKTALFAADVLGLGITGLGSQKLTIDSETGRLRNNTGVNDATELYTISADIELNVDDILDNILFIIQPDENPDGIADNSRRNDNGFDLNRDASNQTQSETQGLAKTVNEWNPSVFAELHGYMGQFLVEPCTPPHEPNMEYDILVKNFMLGAEAYGGAAIATLSNDGYYAEEFPDTKFWSYYTPLRDDYDPATTTWSAWDDLCTNYGPSYAMLNCGTMGYTIETPYCNEASTRLFECGMYGLIGYVLENKADIYTNQLEFFRRGVENIDARDQMDSWYVNINNEILDEDTWRVPYEGNDNYFPEYYVIPVDAASQRDIADAYEMGAFLLRNGVEVSTLTADTTVGDVTYKAGSLVVNMYQAKRNYANAVLWEGADASASGFPDLYSESVSNFPEMRGFDCIPIDTIGAFTGKLTGVTTLTPKSDVSGSGYIAIIANSGQEAVRAINALLAQGVPVGMITEGDYTGDFVARASSVSAISNEYALSVTQTSTMPAAHQISQPKVFLTGRYEQFSNYKITNTSNYFYEWFKDGYGFSNYRNVHNNGTSAYDVMAFDQQLGFEIVTDPAQANVIIGGVSPAQGETGTAAVAAIRAGTPYIGWGSAMNYVSNTLLSGQIAYTSLGMEALHLVEYPNESLITASYAADEDYTMYTYNCQVITEAPDTAEVLIKAVDEYSFIAGCCLNEAGTPIDGYVEAIALETDGMDLTLFANSIANRAHQQDDYRYVTNAIYSKLLAEPLMTITPNLPPVNPPTTTEPEAPRFNDIGNHWAEDAINEIADLGVMDGVGGSKFAPQTNLTRAMMATMLHRMAGTPTAAAPTFKDVVLGTWYTDAVGWGAKEELIKGYSTDIFAPMKDITRQEMVTLLYRYAMYKGYDLKQTLTTGISTFSDKDLVQAYAKEAMDWAVNTGLIEGRSGNMLAPTATATRAEVATFLLRFLKLVG